MLVVEMKKNAANMSLSANIEREARRAPQRRNISSN
jgi:hypothetical protein